MESIYRIALGIAGVINLLPAVLAFLPEKISSSYGIEILNPNYELLLRHRAVLFGIIGALMIFSSFTKKYYTVSTLVGLVSMTSFVLLYFLIGSGVNSELYKIMITDVVAIVILVIGFFLYTIATRKVV